MNITATETRSVPSLVTMFLTFLRIGATAFGGPAMVPYIRRYVVEKAGWISDREFREGMALTQALPGVTGMHLATYIGVRMAGLRGGALTCLGFILPATIVMIPLALFYTEMINLPAVAAVFVGLRIVLVSIMGSATVWFARRMVRSWKEVVIAALAAAAIALGVSTVFVVVLAGVLGLILYRGHTTGTNEVVETRRYPARPLAVMVAVSVVGFGVLYAVHGGLFDLSVLMMRVSVLSFGGGMNVAALMYETVVHSAHLMDGPTLLDGLALGQVTPGPVVNTATFVGFLLYGMVGTVVATIAMYLPSFLILIGIEPQYSRLKNSRYFHIIVSAVPVSFVGLLATMTVQFALDVTWGWAHVAFGVAAFLALFKLDAIWVIVVAIAVSVVLFQVV